MAERLQWARIVTDATVIVASILLAFSIDAGAWISNRWTIDEAVAISLYPGTTELGNGVRDALVQGGRLQLISDRALRERLATWPGYYAELYDDQLNGRQMVLTQLLPYLTGHGYPLSGVSSVSGPGIKWPVSTQSIAADPALARKLLTDPEYRALIEIRHAFWLHARAEYDNALLAAKQILADLERVRS